MKTIAEQHEMPLADPVDPSLKKIAPQRSLINRAEVKRRMLQYAKDTKAHEFTRVSKQTLDDLEADLHASIRARVNSAPSRGKTL